MNEKTINNKSEIKKSLNSFLKTKKWWERLFGWKNIIKIIEESYIDKIELSNLSNENSVPQEKYTKLESENDILIINNNNLKFKNENLNKYNGIINERLNSNRDQIEKNLEEVKKQTQSLFNVFNSQPATQGKISEIYLESILSDYFDNNDYWQKNLSIGGGTVEFAIRIDIKNENNWIPIDSKSLIPKKITEDKKWIIDEEYIRKIKNEAKKISTNYLNKSNTSSYGIMILPNENIIFEIYKRFGKEIFEISKNFQIYLASPYSFNLFLINIKALNELKTNIDNGSKIYDLLKITQNHFQNFYKQTCNGLKAFNTAFNTHMVNGNKKLEEIESIKANNKLIIQK